MIFGNLGKMGDMVKMAKEMQEKLKQLKDELSREIFQGAAAGVLVKVSGDLELKELNIDKNSINLNMIPKLENAVKEAMNKALKAAKDGAADKMKRITGGLGLPGLPGM